MILLGGKAHSSSTKCLLSRRSKVLILLLFLARSSSGENHGAHFERAKVGFEHGAGALAPADVRFAAGDFSGDGKAEMEHNEGLEVEKAAGGAKTAV